MAKNIPPKKILTPDEAYKVLAETTLRDSKTILKKVRARKCELPGGLLHFVRLMWSSVEPTREFQENWHIEAICEHLEAITYGQITRLLINVPPGFMKLIGDSTPILTPDGYRTHGDLKPGDRVFGPDGKPTTILSVSPKAPADYEVSFSTHETIKCNGDHLWRVFDRRAKEWMVVETRWLAQEVERNRFVIPDTVFDFDNRNREITSITKADNLEPGQCIRVDRADGLYVVGRTNVITHNSLLLNVFWPAWEWGPMRMPSMRFVAASYSQDLTVRDNTKFRMIIESEIYKEHWGHLFGQGLQYNLEKVSNDKTGWKLATSVGGVGTGERGDRVVIDDPNSVKDVESDVKRTSTNQWFTEVIPSRINDPMKSAILVIQQRTHEEDVSGIIMSREIGYEHLMIPMRYDATRRYVTSIGWTDPRGLDKNGDPTDAYDGALAWPDRYTEEVVQREERIMGPFATAGQYQQAPVPRGGAIFERDWWQPWPIADDRKILFPPFEYVIGSVDTAFTEKEENDYCAMTVWGVFRDAGESIQVRGHIDDPTDMMRVAKEERPKVMLMWAWQKRLSLHGPPEERPFDVTLEEWNSAWGLSERQKHWGLVEWVVHTAKQWRIHHLLIETQAVGHSLEQELRRLHSQNEWGVQLINARGDKKARAMAVQHVFSNGLVYAPMYADGSHPTWCQQIIDQFSTFPKTRYKDLVDSGTHALIHLRDAGLLVRKEEHDQAFEDEMQYKRRPKPLYDA